MASIEEEQSFTAKAETHEEAEDEAQEICLDGLDGERIDEATGKAILSPEREQWYRNHFDKARQEYEAGNFTRLPL